MSSDLRTKGIILRRTNFGEADRILNILTPEGKISAIAKGVRKPKSKLAGGVEMLCVSDIVIHKNHSGMGILTSSQMIKNYHNIISDLSRLELASLILKLISKSSEHSDNPDFFSITNQALDSLNQNTNPKIIETWFLFNLAKNSGEEINFYRDTNGEKLRSDTQYVWDSIESALKPQQNGEIGANEIKLCRFMLNAKLNLVEKVVNVNQLVDKINHIAKEVNKF